LIHVVGNAAVDTIIRLDRLPLPGETVVALQAGEDLGGKGANQAVVIARCGQKVRLVAAIGNDNHGAAIRRNLETEGVETDGLQAWPGPTDRCIVYVDRHGENTIVSLIEAALNFDPIAQTGFAQRIAYGDWVLLQGNLRPSVARACLALAREKGATTALNASPTYPIDQYDWGLVDLLVVNRTEAIQLGCHREPLEAARALCSAGAGAVILTLGADGAALINANETLRANAPRVTAIDTVGAGDVFCGTLVSVRAAGFGWERALQAASAAGAVCVTRAGVLASFPTQQEMAAILASELVGGDLSE
jgi:ribokinase